MSQSKTKTDRQIDLSQDEIRLIHRLRLMKKSSRGGPPPMLLVRCVTNHLQLFLAVPSGLVAIDTEPTPE